jgi:hypothetical protein
VNSPSGASILEFVGDRGLRPARSHRCVISDPGLRPGRPERIGQRAAALAMTSALRASSRTRLAARLDPGGGAHIAEAARQQATRWRRARRRQRAPASWSRQSSGQCGGCAGMALPLPCPARAHVERLSSLTLPARPWAPWRPLRSSRADFAIGPALPVKRWPRPRKSGGRCGSGLEARAIVARRSKLEKTRMSKRNSSKYKIDRRLGENIWGRPKARSTAAAMAPASTASAARARFRTTASSCAPSRSSRATTAT